jgi:hypothetical protein
MTLTGKNNQMKALDGRASSRAPGELLPFDGGDAEKEIAAFASPASTMTNWPPIYSAKMLSPLSNLGRMCSTASARSTPRSKVAAEMGETHAESLSKKGAQKCNLE